jgi:hypothetical protein
MPLHTRLPLFAAFVLFVYSASTRPVDAQTTARPELSSGPEIDVRSLGAVPDGVTDSTSAIQKATLNGTPRSRMVNLADVWTPVEPNGNSGSKQKQVSAAKLDAHTEN